MATLSTTTTTYDLHSQAIQVVAATFLAVAWLFVSLRFYVRGFLIRCLGWDDWLITITLASFTLQCAFMLYLAWIETHINLYIPKQLSMALEYVVLEFAFYISTTMFLKLSLAIFFLRIVADKWQRRVILISTAIFTVYCFAFFFIAVFQCGWPSDYLIHKIAGKCVPWAALGPLNYIHGTMNALTDWISVCMPYLVIRNANMHKRDKISVMGVLIVGVIGSIASIVRLAYIEDLHKGTDDDQMSFFSNASSIAIVSIIEPGMGIVAASMATLRPLIKSLMERTHTTIESSAAPNQKDKISAAERGVSSPTSPRHGEFAAYGFSTMVEKSRAQSCPAVELSEVASTPSSSSKSDKQLSSHGSENELFAELQTARDNYEARCWTAVGGNEVRKPSLILPDV